MNENGASQEEVSLFELWENLWSRRKIIACTVVLGILTAVLAIFLMPAKYEAIAIIQVGQLGQVGDRSTMGSLPVEAPVQAVERMKTPAFQRRVAEVIGDQVWLENISRSSSGVVKDLSLQIVKSTLGGQIPLIELRAEGATKEIAQKRGEAIVEQLIKTHDALSMPSLVRMRADLSIAREKLASAERDRAELEKMAASASVRDERFTQLSLVTSLRVQKEAEMFSQRQMIMALETALDAPATQPAKTIEPIFVPDIPVSPKKTLLLVFGAVGGLLLGIIWVFFADACRQAKQRKALKLEKENSQEDKPQASS